MATVHFGRLVGTGGFAKTVAIKRLHRSLVHDESFRRMILEEARLASRVRHPNVVPPLDVLTEGGELLLVMEYVHGESLSRLLTKAAREGEVVPIAVGSVILANVLHGLHAAHEARDEAGQPLDIVHRDVSPQNIMVGADGVARVIDFGIAKAATSEEMTSTGTIKGKLPYLAPEQLEGDPATRRTDVYAASVVFWEVLAGRRLFDGSDEGAVLRNILTMPVQPPSVFNAQVPRAVDDLVLRGLDRDPLKRFASAREMALALEEGVHLATATAVGAWTERLAAEALADRAARIAEVETTAAPPAVELRTVIYEPPPMPEPAFVEGVRPISRETAAAPAPPAGVLTEPEVLIRNVDWLAPAAAPSPPPGAAFSRFLRYLAAFLALTLLVGYAFAPALVRAWIVAGAGSRGLIVTIDRVDVSRKAVRLGDVKAESAELPGATLHAGTVVIRLHWLVPQSITIDDAELTLDGPYGELRERFERYRAKNPRLLAEALAGIRKIDVTAGRIDWKNVAGASTSVLVENLTLDVTRSGVRPLGEDYHLSAPLFTLRVAESSAGPWQLDLERQGVLARTVVRFDPSGSYPGSVTRTDQADGSVLLAFNVPRTSLRDLRVPPALLGGLASARTRLEARGEVSIMPVARAPSVTGHLAFAAGSMAVFPGGPLVDLSLDLPINGDAVRPAPVLAILAVAPADPGGGPSPSTASAALRGTLDLSGRIARLELAGTTGPIPCVKDKAGAGANGIRASIAAALDDYPGATLSFKPVSTCVPRLR